MRKLIAGIAGLATIAAVTLFVIVQAPAAGVPTSISSAGTSRTFVLYRPAHVQRHPALVLVLHGAFASGATMEALTHFDQAADAHGFVVAYPDGGWELGCCTAANARRDDLRFLTNLINDLARTQHIDRSRVYVAGFSLGGAMSYRVACELSSRVAGIASVGGFEYLLDPCKPSQPVAVYEIHGTTDYFGGSCGGQTQTDRGCGFGMPGYEPSVVQTNRQWRRADHCTRRHSTVRFGAVTRQLWPSCAGTSAVQLDTIAGGTHCYPQPTSCADYDATASIWRFFAPRRLNPPLKRTAKHKH